MSDRSRLVVLALPSHLTKDQLLAHLSSLQIPLTDVKLLVNKEGRFRRIAFLGYRNNEDAQKAKEWFDGTWLGGSRIRVDYAKESEELPKGSQQASSSRRGDSPVPVGVSQEALPGTSGLAKAEVEIAAPVEGLDDDAAYLARRLKRTVGSDMLKEDEKGVSDREPQANEGDQFESVKTTDSQKIAITSDGSPASSTRLFLRNLSFAVTQADLEATLRQYGRIEELHIPRVSNGQNKGIGFVQYAEATEAAAARQALDGKPLCGRLLHVLPASAKFSSKGGAEDGLRIDPSTDGSFKQRKKAKLSSQADDSFNWGALYMNSDAVMETLANRYGVSKATLLDPTNSDAASRMALAESFIIQETRDYLSENGVDVECFASTSGTSDTTLLLKNLPSGSSVNTIRSLTSDHGPVRRVLVPPAGTIAVVEFDEPSKAKQALQSLAYRRLGNSVIYVQKAPAAIWNTDGVPTKSIASEPLTPVAPASNAQAVVPRKNTVLFVANLPLATTTAELRTVFQVFKGLDYAKITIPENPMTVENANTRQKGHPIGFVGFKSPEDADRARTSMDGHILGGNVLSVQFAKSKVEEDLAMDVPTSVSSSKLLIKNLPFETNRKELLSVVSPYGRIMSLRVPRNAQARSRGFAFVQYSSSKEASAAKQGLAHTHILGRHVIVEQAE